MILTGKAKEDFYNWLFLFQETIFKGRFLGDEQDVLDEFDILPLTCKNTLIIEWFDSVGILINTPPYYDSMLGYNRGFESIVIVEKTGDIYELYDDNDVFDYRKEATKQAIIKANEIYNNLNK